MFLTWCGEQSAHAALLPAKNPVKTKKAREALGAGTKADVLQREQLAAWFTAVQQLTNPIIAAYLQMMPLTGARPGEVLALRWEVVNTQWKGICICDKVEGTREIAATPYMLHLLATLPRRNEWIFSSPTSATGCLTEWLETPAGVVAQIQGHMPSATAEKHYKVRPLELLRVHHEKIEAWILEQAGIVFTQSNKSGALQLVV